MTDSKKVLKIEILLHETEDGRFQHWENYFNKNGRVYQGWFRKEDHAVQHINSLLNRPYWKTIRYCKNKIIKDVGKDLNCHSWLFTSNEDGSKSTPTWEFVDSIPLKYYQKMYQ